MNIKLFNEHSRLSPVLPLALLASWSIVSRSNLVNVTDTPGLGPQGQCCNFYQQPQKLFSQDYLFNDLKAMSDNPNLKVKFWKQKSVLLIRISNDLIRLSSLECGSQFLMKQSILLFHSICFINIIVQPFSLTAANKPNDLSMTHVFIHSAT